MSPEKAAYGKGRQRISWQHMALIEIPVSFEIRSLQLPGIAAEALREDHRAEGCRHQVRRAAGHRSTLVDEAAGGQGRTLCQALEI